MGSFSIWHVLIWSLMLAFILWVIHRWRANLRSGRENMTITHIARVVAWILLVLSVLTLVPSLIVVIREANINSIEKLYYRVIESSVIGILCALALGTLSEISLTLHRHLNGNRKELGAKPARGANMDSRDG